MSDSIANWMTAVSTLVGVATIGFAFWEYRAKEKAEQIAHWQRVLVYKIISEVDGITFRDLKQRYVTEATQLIAFRLPSEEIQDDSLRFVLLDLQRDRVVFVGENNTYRASVQVPDLATQNYLYELNRQRSLRVAAPYVLRLLEREPGKYSTDELHTRLHDDKIEIDADALVELITDLRESRVLRKDLQGKLYPVADELGDNRPAQTVETHR